jgi:regulator of RNase E activity RraA
MTDLVARLQAVDACGVSDALDRLEMGGVVLGIGPMWGCPRIAGRVMTVRLRKAAPGEKSKHHLGTQAIVQSGPGTVIVVEHQEHDEAAGWGGILSLAAKTRGIEGVIVDGNCRDIDDSRDAAFPVYGRARTPMTARGRVVEDYTGEPIRVGGLEVSPGDYVIADHSGVVFIRAEDAEEVISVAEELVAKEKLMAADVKAGKSVVEVMGTNYETMLEK